MIRNGIKEMKLLRDWGKILKTKQHMEELVLKLMANPDTEDTHLAQVHAMYAEVCHSVCEASIKVANALQQSKQLTGDNLTTGQVVGGE